MKAGTLLARLAERGIDVKADGTDLVVRPGSRLTDADRATIRQHKAELLAELRAHHDRGDRGDVRPADSAGEAAALLNRLRCSTLPTGRMPVMNQLAKRLAPFALATDAPAILGALRDFERELVALGGAPDLEPTEAFSMIERSFPGARLVEVRKLH